MSNIVLWQAPAPKPRSPAQRAATERMRKARAAKASRAAGRKKAGSVVLWSPPAEGPQRGSATGKRRKSRRANWSIPQGDGTYRHYKTEAAAKKSAARVKKKRKKAATSQKSATRKTTRRTSARSTSATSHTRRKPRGRALFGGTARVKRAGKRAVTIVGPHKSKNGRACRRCGQYHDLRQHWSHGSAPHNKLTRTEHSYLCERYGVCPKPKKKVVKKKVVRRKKKSAPSMTRKQACVVLCREKYLKRSKKRK